MRHHTAAQKGESGGWHYVSLSRHGGHALGYCAEHEPHVTEQDARECYAKYQRDRVRLDGQWADWTGCEVTGCDAPTKAHARIEGDGFHTASLCAEHLTREHAIDVLGLNGPAGDAWVS
jgi:hypothetical protein